MSKRRANPKRNRSQRRNVQPGTAPGLLTQRDDASPSSIRVIAFDPQASTEMEGFDRARIAELRAKRSVIWIDMIGLQDIDTIRSIGDAFELHGLALEDVVNVHQRPKAESYESALFIVLRMPSASEHVDTEQMALFLGDGFVLTFQEKPGDWFDPIRQRIRDPQARMRTRKSDYLAYTLIDAVIDSFFPLLENLGERLEDLEEEIMDDPQPEHVPQIHALRRDLLTVRRAIWPMRELLNALLRDEHARIETGTNVFLRDCYDHTVQLMDMVDTNREIVSGLLDMHLSSISNRMNEIMKVLTIIATIFMPLAFVASLYGMNFDRNASPWNMPELGWTFGYPFALALMAVITIGLLVYFRRKGWLGKPRRAGDNRPDI
jgi:magnesium transporter